jgi:hypothetical protein
MFKKPHLSGAFFKEPKKKQLKEEKLLTQVIREQSRQDIIEALSSHNGDQLPEDREVEEVLDLLIDRLRREGILKSILDEYLQEKIATERARSGI